MYKRQAVQEAMVGDQRIFLVTQREVETEEPQQKELFEIGTIGTIKQVIKLPKKILRILVVGEERAMLRNIECGEPYICLLYTSRSSTRWQKIISMWTLSFSLSDGKGQRTFLLLFLRKI